jgi:RsiW-degrading membrane proteinase PrsW (M82 family)
LENGLKLLCMLPTAILTVLLLIGWTPFYYRLFHGDGKGWVLFRAILWGLFMMVPTFLIAELTYRLPAPVVYPIAFLVVPIIINGHALLKSLLHRDTE